MILARPNSTSLSDLELFRGCSPRELHAISRLGTWVHVPAGRVLMREGAIGREFLVVVLGTVAVTRGNVEIALVRTGGALGEIALLSPNQRRTATATTCEETTVIAFQSREFRELLDAAPPVTQRLLRNVATIATRSALQGAADPHPSDRPPVAA